MKKVAVILLVITLMTISVIPASAACASVVYFDKDNGKNTAPNNGTEGLPVADIQTAYSIGQGSGQSGCIYEITPDGNVYRGAYAPLVQPLGVPVATSALYVLLAVLAAGLIVGGRWLQRRNTIAPTPTTG